MSAKALLVICASALFAQSTYCAGYAGSPFGASGYGLGAGYGFGSGLGYGIDGCGCGVASTGGGLPVASASPLPPFGVSVLSENVYEGGLCVGGNLPFLGSVAVEGVLPSAGTGAVSYGCGTGCGIAVEEGPVATGIAPSVGGFGYGPAGLSGFGGYNGLGFGFGGYGYGLGGGPFY